jgi:hypothetical protein
LILLVSLLVLLFALQLLVHKEESFGISNWLDSANTVYVVSAYPVGAEACFVLATCCVRRAKGGLLTRGVREHAEIHKSIVDYACVVCLYDFGPNGTDDDNRKRRAN